MDCPLETFAWDGHHALRRDASYLLFYTHNILGMDVLICDEVNLLPMALCPLLT